MKRAFFILSLLSALSLQAQVSFRTIVPQQPVIAGESFQVQYILEGADKKSVISPPLFRGFRLISGPNIYTGNVKSATGSIPVRNFVYTLEAPKTGRFIIPAAVMMLDNMSISSREAIVEVILPQDAARFFNKKGEPVNPDYYLRPGEDPYQKIRENLFLRVLVDKKSCRVGEPVLATFKLYSRLESKTDIEKNPGFYGFTVYDMVGLADKQVATEKINGKLFDVHTIRKVQLYPLQAGRFSIDPLEVRNRVEFSRSAVYKRTEQEIAEGMMGIEKDEPAAEGTMVYETVAATEPFSVEVRPLPEKTKPAAFSGAVGRFMIQTKLSDSELAKNEQGFLEITISGKGNFIQLEAPAPNWPPGVEGFEPVINDVLDKSKTPLNGSRSFRYPFVSATPGIYTIQPVSISYFDTDSNSYKTISTGSIPFEISNRVIITPETETPKVSFAERNERAARIAGGIAVLTVLLILLYWIFIRKDKKISVQDIPEAKVQFSADLFLEPAIIALEGDDKTFFRALQSSVWTFAAAQFGIPGSLMNKKQLSEKMDSLLLDTTLSQTLLEVLEKCEAGIFTNARLEDDRMELLQRVRTVMDKATESLL